MKTIMNSGGLSKIIGGCILSYWNSLDFPIFTTSSKLYFSCTGAEHSFINLCAGVYPSINN